MHTMSKFNHLQLLSLSQAVASLSGSYFVTGTDTEVGKTTTTRHLIKALAEQDKTCYAIKPVTAGTNEAGESDDAKQIDEFASVKPPLSAIAPILLETPCSPHIAGKIDGVKLTTKNIVASVRKTLDVYPAECVLVEGAGGWFTPINDKETLADVAIALDLPIILVVGIKLGCLNHAVLTLQAIWQAGGTVAMVVFNPLTEHTAFETEQIDWLKNYVIQKVKQSEIANHKLPSFYVNEFLG